MKEIGDLLRRRREELGISLAAAQAATKIRMRYLEAIEKGEELSYPGEVYYRGFMKSYASFLGLDGAEIVARYKALKEARDREAQARLQQAESSAEEPPEARGTEAAPVAPAPDQTSARVDPRTRPPEKVRARPRRRRSPRRLAILALVIAVCGLVYLRWYNNVGSRGRFTAPLDPSARPAAGAGARPEEPAAPPAAPTTPSTPAVQPESPPPASAQDRETPESTAEQKPAFEFTREERSRSLTAISARVDSITLAGEVQGGQCWVRVEADGALLQEGLLQPGTTRTWEARDRLFIRVGAPAVMRFRLNGVDLGQAGPEGPARDFVITAVRGD